MQADWIWGLIGGLFIGSAAALYLLGNGRIMGASGILGGLVDGSARRAWAERGAFLAGVIGVPALMQTTGTVVATTNITQNLALVIVAGLMVGVGTRVGNGCTSGHGVCGISRLNPRGIVATLVYIGAGAVAVIALRNITGAL